MIQLADGKTDIYLGNIITEILWAMCNNEGRNFLLLQDIIRHHKNGTTISKYGSTAYHSSFNENCTPAKRTKVWEVKVGFAGNESVWPLLKDVKESNPVKLAKYAKSNKIDIKPTFN